MSSSLKPGFRNSLILLSSRPPSRSRSIRFSSMQTAARKIPISLIPRSKRVFSWRSSRRLFSASSSPSESFDELKRRRVSKGERRAMLEEFVDRYRASNGGRFPTASHAKKEIGGSYYVARQVIQELEYNHRMSLKKPEKPVELEEKTDKIELSVDKDEDPLLTDGETVRLLEVKLPLCSSDSEQTLVKETSVSSDSEQTLVKEPTSASTTEIVHSDEQVVEHFDNSVEVKLPPVTSDSKLASAKEPTSSTEIVPSNELVVEHVNNSKVKLPLITSASEHALVKEPTSSTTKVIHSNDLVVEHVDNSSMSRQILFNDHKNKEPLELDYPSGLSDENLKDNVHDSTKVQASSSVPPISENEADILHAPTNNIQGPREGKTSCVSGEGGFEQRSKEEVSKPDKLDSKRPRMLVEDASTPKRSSIWGNLKSLADGIINFWKKK